MGQLVAALLPDMLGLIATPAAIVACVLLLDTASARRNVALFTAAFLLPYVIISAVVVLVGNGKGVQAGAGTARSWVSLAVGVLFLLGGAVSWVRKPAADESHGGAPGWVRTLTQPRPRGLVLTGLTLSVLNPNVAILLSGLNTVLALASGAGQRVVGAVLLLGSALLDFVVPAVVYTLLGSRAGVSLAAAKSWLVSHNRPILVVVLLFFGAVFAVRGLLGVL